MGFDRDNMEARLLSLGRQERDLEEKIRALLTIARERGRAGDYSASDAAWNLQKQLGTILADVKDEITQIERVYYAIRSDKTPSR